MKHRILIAAAGTGGHVFPALAVAKRLQLQGWQVDWLGTREGRLESRVIPAANIALHSINMTGVRGHGVARLVEAPLLLLAAVRECRRLLQQLQPDVVLTFGGYVCAPMGIASKLAGIPLLVHEQNAVPGLTTRLLAPLAKQVMLGLPLTKRNIKKGRLTGNPLRAEIEQLAQQTAAAEQGQQTLRLLVVGGSLGARVLNETLPAALQQVKPTLRVMHQCGQNNSAALQQAYQQVPQHQVTVSDFIDDMAAAYQQADLVICRAGALTVAELAALGKPAIFVPLPHAVDDHQTENAKTLVAAGAAKLLPQTELTATRLAKLLQSLLQQPEQLWTMARFARQQACPQATASVAQMCLDATQSKAAEQVN